jgi:hypothetical protein
MNADWQPLPVDGKLSASVILHPTATPLEVMSGTATDGIDLSQYASKVSQSADSAQVTLHWSTQLNGPSQPVPGQLLELVLNGRPLWIGPIETINDYRMERGNRELSITARSRDGNPLWRDTQRVSDIYPAGTWLSIITEAVALSMGLTTDEIDLPSISATTIHSNTQLANISAWAMLETLYLPVGYQPWVDALGRLKTVSRDTTREADIVLTADRVKAISGSRSTPPVTVLRVKWLDPLLSKVTQQDQPLQTYSMTAGFFQLNVTQEVKFSDDGSQRAENTYLNIKQSCNSGLLPVADESYTQLTETTGKISLDSLYYSQAFVTAALASAWSAGSLPDIAPTGGGPTAPIGKKTQAALLYAAMFVMCSMGTGSYEVRGQPFDYVRARNTTEAFNTETPEWMQKVVEIENDFVMNQAMSEAFATRELLYQARGAVSYGVSIVDDPRIEVGDILELPDASRLYVTGYSRDLSRGSASILNISGFRV